MIVALPGLFSYLFCLCHDICKKGILNLNLSLFIVSRLVHIRLVLTSECAPPYRRPDKPNETRRVKNAVMAYTDSKCPSETAHPSSVAKTCAVCSRKR